MEVVAVGIGRVRALGVRAVEVLEPFAFGVAAVIAVGVGAVMVLEQLAPSMLERCRCWSVSVVFEVIEHRFVGVGAAAVDSR